MNVGLEHYLVVSVALFSLGLLGVIPGAGDVMAAGGKTLLRGAPDAVRGANRAQPPAGGMMDYLSGEERAAIGPRSVATFDRSVSALDPATLRAMALGGADKLGWYKKSAEAIDHIFGADSPGYRGLLAATSPQTTVEENMRNSLRVWKAWNDAGRPSDPDQVLQVLRKLAHQIASGDPHRQAHALAGRGLLHGEGDGKQVAVGVEHLDPVVQTRRGGAGGIFGHVRGVI